MKVNEENAGRRLTTFIVILISIPFICGILSLIFYLIGFEWASSVMIEDRTVHGLISFITCGFWMFDLRIGLSENLRLEQKKYKWYQIIGEED